MTTTGVVRGGAGIGVGGASGSCVSGDGGAAGGGRGDRGGARPASTGARYFVRATAPPVRKRDVTAATAPTRAPGGRGGVELRATSGRNFLVPASDDCRGRSGGRRVVEGASGWNCFIALPTPCFCLRSARSVRVQNLQENIACRSRALFLIVAGAPQATGVTHSGVPSAMWMVPSGM